jgi:hypothetical protein
MPKEKPLQDQGSIRGGDVLRIAETGYNGKVPNFALHEVEAELRNVQNGDVSLVFIIRDSRLARYETRAYKCSYSSEGGFSGPFPFEAFQLLERKSFGLIHGVVEVFVTIQEGKFASCSVNIIRSFIPGGNYE